MAGGAGTPPRGEAYTTTAKVLHWLVALLVLATIPVGLGMTRASPGPLQDALFILHKGIGAMLIVLLPLRILWRLTHPPPALPGLPARQVWAARSVHLALYVMLVVMAASGYVLTVAGGYPIELLDRLGVPPLLPRSKPVAGAATAIHLAGKYLIGALIVLHVAAALHHALVRRDGVARRMAFGRRG